MQNISIQITGCPLTQEQAQKICRLIAEDGNLETEAVARYNKALNACSPCTLKGNLGDRPGWEVYGENHGGRLKISVNNDQYVFIFS